MTNYDEDDGMDQLANTTAQKVDTALADRELAVLLKTSTEKLLSLKPKISDPATYDKFIAIVAQSTANNEAIADFKARAEALGAKGCAVIKEVLKHLA